MFDICDSVSCNPASPPACDWPFDEYGDIRFEDEKARLDNFAIQLSNYEAATGYIFAYAGKKTYESEAAERLQASERTISLKYEAWIRRELLRSTAAIERNFTLSSSLFLPAPTLPMRYLLSPRRREIHKTTPSDCESNHKIARTDYLSKPDGLARNPSYQTKVRRGVSDKYEPDDVPEPAGWWHDRVIDLDQT